MRKNILASLMAVVLCLFAFTACDIGLKDKTYNATDSSYFEFTEIESGYAISVKEGATLPEKIKLPIVYEGKEVVEISAEAFKGTDIKGVIIPEGYSIIGKEAFSGCENLESVTIATQIGGTKKDLTVRYSAFKGCSKLATVEFGDCVKVIDAYAFSDTMITKAIFKKVEKIGKKAFENCTTLSKVYIPATLTDIADDAFDGCLNVKYECSVSNTVYEVVDNKIVKK